MIAEFRQVEPYLLGDFYPLTVYSLENTIWMAWQFDRPEIGEGMVNCSVARRVPTNHFASSSAAWSRMLFTR